MKHNRRERTANKRKSKTSTRKIVARLTYSPNKHKQKSVKVMRKKLQDKVIPTPKPCTVPSTLKFGSFNVNGLDLEAGWAVEQLLSKRGYDVRTKNNLHCKIYTVKFTQPTALYIAYCSRWCSIL